SQGFSSHTGHGRCPRGTPCPRRGGPPGRPSRRSVRRRRSRRYQWVSGGYGSWRGWGRPRPGEWLAGLPATQLALAIQCLTGETVDGPLVFPKKLEESRRLVDESQIESANPGEPSLSRVEVAIGDEALHDALPHLL